MSYILKIYDKLDLFQNELKYNYNINDELELENIIHNNIMFFTFNNTVKINDVAKDPELYITVWDNTNLIGCLKVLCLNNYNNLSEYFRTIMYISVHNEYRNQGVAKLLLLGYFNYIKENKIDDILYLSPWTKSGWTYIKPLIYKLSNEYKIQLNDKDYIFTWDI